MDEAGSECSLSDIQEPQYGFHIEPIPFNNSHLPSIFSSSFAKHKLPTAKDILAMGSSGT